MMEQRRVVSFGGRGRLAAVGVLIAGCYLVVAVATGAVTGRRVLPLFEGVGPPPSYQWVTPPAQFASGNVQPKPSTTRFTLGSAGNDAGGASDASGQFVLTLSAGAIPPKAGETAADLVVEPLDPATLAPLPESLHGDGNAYRVTVRYTKSGTTLTAFANDASAVIGLPVPPTKLFVTADTKQWTEVPTAPAPQSTTLGVRFRQLGVYLAGTIHTYSTPTKQDSTSLGVIVAAVLVGVLLVGGAVWFLFRLRSMR